MKQPQKIKTLGSLTDQSGFSLAGLLIALGMMALMSMGLAGLFASMNRETKAMSARLNKIGLAQDLRTLMAESKTCTGVFASDGQALTTTANSITNLKGNLGATGSVSAGEELSTYGVRVKRFYARNPVSAGVGPENSRLFLAEVFLEAEELGSPGVSRSFKASSVGFTYFELPADGNVIQRCYSLESQGDLLKMACLKFGGAYDETTRDCKITPSPADSCASLGGSFGAGACQFPDRACQVPADLRNSHGHTWWGESLGWPPVGSWVASGKGLPSSIGDSGVMKCTNGRWGLQTYQAPSSPPSSWTNEPGAQ